MTPAEGAHGARALPQGPSDCLAKMAFVITGVLPQLSREEAKAFVEKHGGRVTTAVSGKTNYLVIGSRLEDGRPIEEGSKYRKATEKGTEKVDEDGLVNIVLSKMPAADRAAFENRAKQAEAKQEETAKEENEKERARVAATMAHSGARGASRRVDEST